MCDIAQCVISNARVSGISMDMINMINELYARSSESETAYQQDIRICGFVLSKQYFPTSFYPTLLQCCINLAQLWH